MPLSPSDRFWTVAALVSIDKNDHGVLHVTFQCKIKLVKGMEKMVQADLQSWATTLELVRMRWADEILDM